MVIPSLSMVSKLEQEKAALRLAELKAIEWKPLWTMPALMAGGVLVLFFLIFREPEVADEKSDSDEKTA